MGAATSAESSSATAPTASTVAELLDARRDDDGCGLLFEEHRWSWRAVYEETATRARVLATARIAGSFHVGVLLDNVPEYLFWLGAAALAGATIVGINPTRRGQELAGDIRFTDCQLVITDDHGAQVLAGLDLGLAADRVWLVDSDDYKRHLAAVADRATDEQEPAPAGQSVQPVPSPDDLLVLLFTSGTTGSPKAVRCTQSRLASIARRAADGYGFRRDDICYCPMPLFHGNAIMALWAPALAVGATVALTRRFSASGFIGDVRRYGATRFTYVGTALAYVLATAPLPDDADNPLLFGFGTEASAPDREIFERRFGCRLVEGYGSSEGGTAINVTPETPPGALGTPAAGDDVAVIDSKSRRECPRACFDASGRFVNADVAIGEIVNRSGGRSFEGYYKNSDADAERVHDGWYWSGDLGYRDEAGFFYFAGRGGAWVRVDSENFATAPVERIVERHPDISTAAVYGVPDAVSGDQVMVTIELRPGAVFDPDGFAAFLQAQPDLGTKWAPRYVRVSNALPLTASGKVTTRRLQAERWECDDPVFFDPGRPPSAYRRLSEEDRLRIRTAFADHGRASALDTVGPNR